MNYERQLKKVIDHINHHLDEKLTLEQLSSVACFSKYHFHRLFTAYMGLSVQQYIRWLRLKRSAYQLIGGKDKSIIEIAINAGFESHEAYTRAFKQHCGVSPSEFRTRQRWNKWETTPYRLPKQEVIKMNVVIKEVNEKRLAMVEHHGDPTKLGDTFYNLIDWSKDQSLRLNSEHTELFGFVYNDPDVTPADEFRFDFGITVPEQKKLVGDVLDKKLPAGRYAVAIHKGSHDELGNTFEAMYRDWLPNSGEELDDVPCIINYLNYPHDVAETALLTECWLKLK